MDFSTESAFLDSLGIKKYPSTINASTTTDAIMILVFSFFGLSGFDLTTSFDISLSC